MAGHILLNELGIQYKAVITDPKSGVSEELKSLNPKAKVPVLVINGQVVTENVAILTAIAQLAPDRHLLGRNDLEKIRVYEYLAYVSGTLHGTAYKGVLRPQTFIDDESALDKVRDKGKKAVLECYEFIEAGLKGVHAVGDGLTVVDPYLYVFWRWGSMFLSDMQTRFPKYAALVVELGKLESVHRTIEQEGIEGYLVGSSSL